MVSGDRLLIQILRGGSDSNIPFKSLCHLLEKMGFDVRIHGDHHIFTKEGIIEILNLQPRGSKAKAYQVKMEKYEVIIYWSDEDETFVAEVPELPGCMADGATREEALRNAQVVIKEWIKTAQELGRLIPEPKGRLIFA